MSDVSGNDALDEGLSRLAATGPEYRGGLSNHGPMAAEALVRLGRADAVGHWLDGYLQRLDEPPRPSDRVTDETWRDALGKLNRVADWEVYLRDQLADEPWRDVLARWWPRLLPGVAAAATHGIIRTSHAARSLAAAEQRARHAGRRAATSSPARSRTGPPATLELPGRRASRGRPGRGGRGARPPVLPEPAAGGPDHRPAAGRGFRRSPASAPRSPRSAGPATRRAALRDLAGEFTAVFLGYGRTQPIDVPARGHRPGRRLLGAAAAARRSSRAPPTTPCGRWPPRCTRARRGVTPEPLPAARPPAPDDLADRAVATGDEHAIKLTEACLRLHAQTPDPVFLHAAARASDLLGGS